MGYTMLKMCQKFSCVCSNLFSVSYRLPVCCKKYMIILSSDMMDSWLSMQQFVWESRKDNEKENGEEESEG